MVGKSFNIISYWTFKDKNSFVGGLRPYRLFQKLETKGIDTRLITPVEDTGKEYVIKKIIFPNLLKSFVSAFPPDYTIFWGIKVFFKLSRIKKSEKTIILTTLPPNGIGIIGLFAKIFLKNIYWIIDFRDLWTLHPIYNPPITKKYIDPYLEKKYFENADLVILNTKWDMEINRKLYPNIISKSIYIRNGFDKIVKNKSTNNFSFIYTGGTTAGQATAAISRLLNQLSERGIQAICEFYGEYDKGMEGNKFIKYKGVKEPEDVPILLTKYKFGFIYLPKNSEQGGRVAQKFYDYIGSGVIPICFRPSVEMVELIDYLNVGIKIFDTTPLDEIIIKLNSAKFDVIDSKLDEFTRSYQFEKMFEYLEQQSII